MGPSSRYQEDAPALKRRDKLPFREGISCAIVVSILVLAVIWIYLQDGRH